MKTVLGACRSLGFLTAGLISLATLASCAEEEPENFGTVRIELEPVNGAVEIFDGTVEVVATVNYEACLVDFYLSRQSTYKKDGPDGAPVFSDWESRLCSDFTDIPDCEVSSIEQTLLDVNDVYRLAVTYKINDSSTLPYRELHVGPIPVEEFAACSGGEGAIVGLAPNGVVGKNADGDQIWRISTVPPQTEARAGQGAPLRVEIQSTLP
ncbi:hypothetical protein [Enhygromyxa salina]|nr:hypothetical protein [Enhygromyxa salina]